MRLVENKKGSTLIEIILSVAIIATVFVIFQATVNTIFLNRASKHRDLALRIAQTEISSARALPFASLPASGPVSSTLLSSLPQSQANLTVTAVNDETKQLEVLVSWREPTAQNTSTINLTTLITQGGI